MDQGGTEGVRRTRDLLDAAADRLRDAGVRDEALAEYVEPRAVLGIRRDPTMRPLGRVWRVGALLLGSSRRPRAGSGPPPASPA